MIDVHGVSAFDDNYIWLPGRPAGDTVAIVDPGDADPVMEFLDETRLRPEAILITHHHGDHTGGIRELLSRYTLPVFGPQGESIAGVTHRVGDGETVTLPESSLTFQVLETPGHTRGHVCYTGHGVLFCGDTLFTAGCGRLFEGTAEQMYRSLSRLAELPDETLVYCAHEYTLANLGFARVAEPDNPDIRDRQREAERLRAAGKPTVPSLLGLEKRTNPFLRSSVPALARAAAGYAGRPLPEPAEVFATVRAWKDALD